MTIFLATLAALTPLPANMGPAWAEFSRKPALRLVRTYVEVGTLGYDRKQKRLEFWLRRTVVTGAAERSEVTWADTRTCPQARPLLASMRSIPVPRFAPVGSSEGPPIVLDGISYTLKSYSDHGQLTANTNVGTPVASWIEGAFTALEGCWRSQAPRRVS